MASVNYRKCKSGSGDAGALIRHSDKIERLKHEHTNEHIDKEKTPNNLQGSRDYQQTMAAMQKRLAELDAMPGANHRKDRTELFMLEVPIPYYYDPVKFAEIVMREICKQYGARNVLNFYLHLDEIHDYLDHGEVKTSLAHLHVPVIPEMNGKLNGKLFSSRQQMQQLNRSIDKTVRQELGGPGFLTGEEPRKKTVEEMKLESFKELQERTQEMQQQLQAARQQRDEAILDADAADRRADEAAQRAAAAAKEAQEARHEAQEATQELQTVQRELRRTRALLERVKGHFSAVMNWLRRAATVAHLMPGSTGKELQRLLDKGNDVAKDLKELER